MDLRDRPKDAPQPCPTHRVLPRNSKKTLRELLTKDETDMKLLSLLKQLATRPKGPWKDYASFYQTNMSGDLPTFSEANQKYIKKMVADLEKEIHRQNTEGEMDAAQKG